MCDATKDGYTLKSGKFIPYNIDITSLNIKDVNALNDEPASKWEVFVIQSEIKNIFNKIEDNHGILIEILENNQDVHLEVCPLNKSGISDLIDKRVEKLSGNGLGEIIRSKVDEHLKNKGIKAYQGFKGFLRDFILIATSVTIGIGLYKLLGI